MDNGYIACPYYLGQNHTNGLSEIRCEGVIKNSFVKLSFRNREAFREHMKTYCYQVRGCSKCFVCKELNRKYGVDYEV